MAPPYGCDTAPAVGMKAPLRHGLLVYEWMCADAENVRGVLRLRGSKREGALEERGCKVFTTEEALKIIDELRTP